MTMDFMEQYKIKQADAGYQEFSTKIKDAVNEKQRINMKQCQLMRKIVNLNYAEELVRDKSFDFECTTDEVDTALKNATNSDGEGWFYTYHSAAEEIESMMIQLCVQVANLKVDYDVLTERIKMLNAEQDKYGDELIKEYKANAEKEVTANV